ncbi:hypothetical protein JVT61DRAFT_3785 [Boletus reticuloceps]|uniref:Uncharacterized protein n=1 Tax=Boletus reticuloceps TaxID=495285 RepID=A0A8I3A9S1_9AGAM|nr:hypothetical protein JVT61DRAFT_3785 [Boletus reticuloceps]
MRRSASVQHSNSSVRNIHCAPPLPSAFVAPTVPHLYSSFDMVFLIKNNVASVEDVAHLSLSPAGRVAKRCTPGCSPTPSSLNLADSPVSLPSICSSQAPPATPPTGQTTVASTVPAEPARSPEFSDEESQRESDNFSFHFSQDEEWTDEVEARMQNAIDRMLEDARRQLAVPVLNFSVLFPDDLLADSVAHQTAANPRTSRFGASSSQIDDHTSVKEQDDVESMVEDIEYGIDNVWEELATRCE